MSDTEEQQQPKRLYTGQNEGFSLNRQKKVSYIPKRVCRIEFKCRKKLVLKPRKFLRDGP